jgi:SPP1 family predicted phage head-tail adaptor
MRHRVTLEAPVEVADGAGGVTRGWAAVATMWAAIEPRDPRPAIVGEAPAVIASHRVTLRWRAGVVAGQRLRLGQRLLQIRSVADPHERKAWLWLQVEETGP